MSTTQDDTLIFAANPDPDLAQPDEDSEDPDNTRGGGHVFLKKRSYADPGRLVDKPEQPGPRLSPLTSPEPPIHHVDGRQLSPATRKRDRDMLRVSRP